MSRNELKQKFMKEYNCLPNDAKLQFVETHLSGLLDHVPKERASKVFSSLSRLRVWSSGIREIDLKSRKAELSALFLEIETDAKCFFLKERSNRDILIEQILSSITIWMNDIWNTVYIHRAKFLEAHEGLMYIMEIIDKIVDMPMPPDQRCKCMIMSMPMYVEIRKDSDGSLIKKFALTGALKLAKPIVWLWRELFLSYLAHGGKGAGDEITRMVSEIEQKSNWGHIERILYGGSARRDDCNPEGHISGFVGSDEDAWADNDLEDDEDDFSFVSSDDEEYDLNCAYYMTESHWNNKIKSKRMILWDIIEAFLISIFSDRPSYTLYIRLTELSFLERIDHYLLDILESVHSDSSDNFVAAVRIHMLDSSGHKVAHLLHQHPHLLRPRDDNLYQAAVSRCLSLNPLYKDFAISIIEKELMDTVSSVYAKLRFHFPGIEDKRLLDELDKHLKIRQGTSTRKTRIEQWVQQVRYVSRPDDGGGGGGGGGGNQNPFVLAAMMMGLPPPPGTPGTEEFEDEISLDILDQDEFRAREQGVPGDPELEDLKEEFRPKLKERFEGWYKAAIGMKAPGHVTTFKVYKALVEKMPVFKATDVVEELILVMSPNSSKAYLCDALDFIDTFSKNQRKRIKAKYIASKATKQPAKTVPPTTAIATATPTPTTSTSGPTLRKSNESPPPLLGSAGGDGGETSYASTSARTIPIPSTSSTSSTISMATTTTTNSNLDTPGGLDDVD